MRKSQSTKRYGQLLCVHKNAGTFSSGGISGGVSVVTATWGFSWNTDANGFLTRAKARHVARGFGQGFVADYFKTSAATPAVMSMNLDTVGVVQTGRPLSHSDVTQAFVPVRVDTNLPMKLPEGCGPVTGDTVRLKG